MRAREIHGNFMAMMRCRQWGEVSASVESDDAERRKEMDGWMDGSEEKVGLL
jgi:hypothetical protein